MSHYGLAPSIRVQYWTLNTRIHLIIAKWSYPSSSSLPLSASRRRRPSACRIRDCGVWRTPVPFWDHRAPNRGLSHIGQLSARGTCPMIYQDGFARPLGYGEAEECTQADGRALTADLRAVGSYCKPDFNMSHIISTSTLQGHATCFELQDSAECTRAWASNVTGSTLAENMPRRGWVRAWPHSHLPEAVSISIDESTATSSMGVGALAGERVYPGRGFISTRQDFIGPAAESESITLLILHRAINVQSMMRLGDLGAAYGRSAWDCTVHDEASVESEKRSHIGQLSARGTCPMIYQDGLARALLGYGEAEECTQADGCALTAEKPVPSRRWELPQARFQYVNLSSSKQKYRRINSNVKYGCGRSCGREGVPRPRVYLIVRRVRTRGALLFPRGASTAYGRSAGDCTVHDEASVESEKSSGLIQWFNISWTIRDRGLACEVYQEVFTVISFLNSRPSAYSTGDYGVRRKPPSFWDHRAPNRGLSHIGQLSVRGLFKMLNCSFNLESLYLPGRACARPLGYGEFSIKRGISLLGRGVHSGRWACSDSRPSRRWELLQARFQHVNIISTSTLQGHTTRFRVESLYRAQRTRAQVVGVGTLASDRFHKHAHPVGNPRLSRIRGSSLMKPQSSRKFRLLASSGSMSSDLTHSRVIWSFEIEDQRGEVRQKAIPYVHLNVQSAILNHCRISQSHYDGTPQLPYFFEPTGVPVRPRARTRIFERWVLAYLWAIASISKRIGLSGRGVHSGRWCGVYRTRASKVTGKLYGGGYPSSRMGICSAALDLLKPIRRHVNRAVRTNSCRYQSMDVDVLEDHDRWWSAHPIKTSIATKEPRCVGAWLLWELPTGAQLVSELSNDALLVLLLHTGAQLGIV
ncbi:hypothetical protein BC827DRAFT_1156735 [Russula dissimulans]|nr:hypothetical protein BC827DRAFT_1156735 [Russula dissimulans]